MQTPGSLIVTTPTKATANANANVEDQNIEATAGRSKILQRREFDPDFLFGAASAAYQHEGAANQYNRGLSTWDDFCLSKPGKIQGGASATTTTDMYHNYKEDIQIMKKIGLNAFRMSISWPRIFPGGRKNRGVNTDGVKYYNDFINELLANGIEPYVTLFHWDLPQALQEEYGGFLSEKLVDDYREYAEFCFFEFGDRVKYWSTFNEPHIFIYLSFGLGIHAPGRGILSSYATGDGLPNLDPAVAELATAVCPNYYTVPKYPEEEAALLRSNRSLAANRTSDTQIYPHIGDAATEPYIAARHLILCHKAAVDSYRKNFQKALKGQIGIVTNCSWMMPRRQNDEDIKATQRAFEFMIGWFMEPITRGNYPQVMIDRVGDRLPPIDEDLSGASLPLFDFVGINYYHSTLVENRNWDQYPVSCFTDVGVSFSTDPNYEVAGPLGTSFYYPRGLYECLRYLSNKYQVKNLYVAENGFGMPNVGTNTVTDTLNDPERINYFIEHIAYVRDAINVGVNVKGYFAWSMFDGFEWGSGFATRFGLIRVDYFDNLKRLPKKSAEFYRAFLGGKPFFLGKRPLLDEEEELQPAAKKLKT